MAVPSPDLALSSCPGRPANRLVVTPRDLLVPFGGSTELNCSLACAGGKVEWMGLDTALGTISSFSTHSILHIKHATVATEGTKICQGRCQGQNYQQTARLKVYGKRSPGLDPQGSPFPRAMLCCQKSPLTLPLLSSPPRHAEAGGSSPNPAPGIPRQTELLGHTPVSYRWGGPHLVPGAPGGGEHRL